MGNIGIITEYNPFHNGHNYQLQQIRSQFPDKKIICIMSGNYVQRGEPAIYNKYLRTECALSSGVDIIFELPTIFATASAEYFATAAVLALAKTGIIETLCFGAEDDNLQHFYTIAKLLIEEPYSYKNALKKNLKEGHSYPKARSLSIDEYFGNNIYHDFLKSPNNILGVEYIKAILRYNVPIKPYIIKRTAAEYHDISIQQKICSATALRVSLKNNPSIYDYEENIPKQCVELIAQSPFGKPVFPKHFYPYIQHALWEHRNHYTDFADVNDEISNQLSNLLHYPLSIDELVQSLSNRNYTTSRIRHILQNIMLGVHSSELQSIKDLGYIRYLRLLGFQKNASDVLKQMKTSCEVPMINKVAHAKKILSDNDYSIFERELSFNMLYNQVYYNIYDILPDSEYKHTVITHHF
ncbi:MAG: nucleotidyltransferase family protein [Eubacteriales bacterium]|nr:nucleotidyltransferase family protein [Eubacteriales bacterium]